MDAQPRSFIVRSRSARRIAIALVTVWASIAGAYHWNWPVGFFVGVLSAAWYLVGRGWVAGQRIRAAHGMRAG